MSALDLGAIRRAHPLPGIVGGVVKLHRAGNEFKACCPFHADRTPSFTIFSGGQRFHCFGCGASGDVLDFIQQAHGVSLRDAAAMLGSDGLPSVVVAPVPPDDGQDRIAEARAIWRSAAPVTGTLAEGYLRHRGLHLPLPDSIRFSSLRYGKSGPQHPCLVAAVASVEGKLVGIQRTYLNAAGTGKAAVPKPKLSLGRVSGGAIRLAPFSACLVVCEGLEDGLTLQQELGTAVWVAAGATMLPNMQFPAGAESIAIGGDGDAAGRAAAGKAAADFTARGLSTRVFFPAGAKDFNAELTEGARA
ncbi:CHC2 zinc finger domain-containing protein [Novosphingobium tardum]|uniref:CHC2 zinc finger domain-containing protein n=1 Tax=Novosphingobium tardum TaxID=1538021 RepID=A0ABV8RJF8_9SPHN